MEIRPARRIGELPEYAFAAVDARLRELRRSGVEPIDLGVGDPARPTPELIRRRCKEAIDERAASGYPSYVGAPELREAVADWTLRRCGVELDADREISITIGSKEAIFNFPEALIDPGDVVLVPSPGYPPYSRGTRFAEGEPWFYPLEESGGFLPVLEKIPDQVARRAKLMWINYPNSPSGAAPGLDLFERVLAWTREREIVLASDEAYSEHYFGDEPPPSALQAGREGLVVFNSLSKRSAMTGWRVGWIAGDPRIVELFRKLKTNVDSGAPTFIQDAAVAALADEEHVREMRDGARRKRDALVAGLEAAGLPRCVPEAALYVWQRAPEGVSSLELAERLMEPDVGVICTPGSLIADEVQGEGKRNPGEGYVRFALTALEEDVQKAADRIAALKGSLRLKAEDGLR